MAKQQSGTFVIRTPTGGITTVAGTPVTAVQYQASASNNAELIYFSVSQSASTTSGMEQVRLVRKTVGATVTIGAVGTNIFDTTANGTSGKTAFQGTLSTTATGVVATVEGTDGDEAYRFNFNNQAGYEKDFQLDGRLWIPPSGIIAVKLKAVLAGTYDVMMVIKEY